MFKIHNMSYFITIDLDSITLNQYHIQGIFGAGIPVWVSKKWAQKIEQYSTQKFLFIRQINSFLLSSLKVEHLTRLLLTQVWYGRRKPRWFHTQKKTVTEIPMHYSYFLLNMWQVTIQKNLDIVFACFRTIVAGGDGLLSIFVVVIFPIKKK